MTEPGDERRKNRKAKRKAVNGDAREACRSYTISLAVSAAVIENAQNLELATLAAGQIARAAAVFMVDEIIVIDDSSSSSDKVGRGAAVLARILQFMETPQYLRKALVGMHPDLRYVGLLPPLDTPHHMRASEWCRWREGVVTHSHPASGSLLDVGLDKEAHVALALKPNLRVTLDMGDGANSGQGGAGAHMYYEAQVSLPSAPRSAHGLYWGYTTRIATGLAGVWEACPFQGGYDLKIGTSERGEYVAAAQLRLPPFRHALLAFGGPHGLEAAAEADPKLVDTPVAQCFDLYLNTCPRQGSRTIRTEEAILISLSLMQEALHTAGRAAAGSQ